ncbi:uncharacterized protein A1O9_02374 [Exophiala aquamarina CBS 119918]|uniref:Hydrophobin n=1 Tax=Exophiala aquamarina CBS 119918 TaxID=1182545 RepID=A0A072PM71_9EURO|nr:uncharacterized protein A1O9_02374 [Exophiala aquamarina CBS 119918]KEF60812.1 hypothetical protein A1O9_02374 [Exophiala aquamarina CBS 119918]
MKPNPILAFSLLLFRSIAFAQTVSQTISYSTDSNGNTYTLTISDSSTITSEAASTASASDTDVGSSSLSHDSSTAGSVYSTATTTFATSTTRGLPAIQTREFTGQGLLVGTCALPQFTILTFPDGGSIEVPLIGCSDDRPDCCPSLNSAEPAAGGTSSTTSTTGSTTSPTPTGVVSILSKYPLTVCPSDMADLDQVCCPIGFSRYGQQIIGNLPCFSVLTTTVYSPDASVLASITSVVAASLSAASTTSTPTISVIVNQVFALGLPCADDVEEEHSGLSTGAKAGVGAGVCVGALLLMLSILAGCMACLRRRKKSDKDVVASEHPVTAGAVETAAGGQDAKNLSAATTMSPGSPSMYSALQMQSQLQTQMHQYSHSHSHVPGIGGGYADSHGYSGAYGHGQAHMVQDQYGGIYSIQPAVMPGSPNHQQQPHPYQHSARYLPLFPQPPAPPAPPAPPLQLYPYRPNQMNQPNASYRQQHSRPPPNIPDPVEADSDSDFAKPRHM